LACNVAKFLLLVANGMFFFTVVTHQRRHILTDSPGIDCLRAAFRTVQEHFPFTLTAIVILPEAPLP
jgi:putative transposase